MGEPSKGAESIREEVAHQRPSPRRYLLVWGALLVLTAATFLSARVDLGEINLALALLIATAKAALVVLFFMHLWDSRGANRVVFGISIFFVLLLMGGMLGDVLTRYPLARPPEMEEPAPQRERGYLHGGQNVQPGGSDVAPNKPLPQP
jgi:cytochrome c oxidase subunit 4